MAIHRARPFILVRPPQRASGSAHTIREALGDEVCRLSRLDRVPNQYKYVINWGNSSRDLLTSSRVVVLNKPDQVGTAINKVESFNVWSASNIPVPAFTADSTSLDRSHIWLARTVLTGSGGAGIMVVRPEDVVPDAPLYVQYIKKAEEYRVHVAFGSAVFVQRKLRVSNNEQTKDEKLIRNYNNGWVFSPVLVEEASEEIKRVAISAVVSLGLDFGAVDIVISNDERLPYVLECNTAPGISSPGLIQAYKQAFLTNLTR